MSKKTTKNSYAVLLIALILVVALAIAAVMVWPSLPGAPAKTPAQTTGQTVQTRPGQTQPIQSQPIQTDPVVDETQTTINLGYGLQITDAGKYAGLYMEDGSNEIVSDVMMVVVENNGDSDVQLAELTALCGGEEFSFSLTNLAVGERAVLLDRDRKPSAGGALDSAVLGTTALFPEPMELHEDVLQVSGLEGMLNVQNISDTDIDSDIYIYYKYAAQDVYYGGITFRVRIEGGLKAGELRQIPAGHYSPEGCAVVQVTIYE